MPFYEYECQDCKYYAEVMQKITDAPLIRCPSCGKPALKKLVSAPVFRLKGAGWYETDFKSDKENKKNLLGTDKEETKAEAKSDAKADAKEAKETKEAKPESKDTKEAKPAAVKSASGGSVRAKSRAVSRAKPRRAKSARRARR